MKTPSDPAVTALLNSGNDYVHFDLWEIILQGGVVVRWTGADRDVLADGVTYLSIPLIDRNNLEETDELATSGLTMTVTADSDDLVNGTPIVTFISNHGFDGAYVTLRRGYNPDWTPESGTAVGPLVQACIGTVIKFKGKVTNVPDISGNVASVSVSSWAALLSVNTPPNLFQEGCNWSVYDANCGVTPASWKVSGTITSGVSSTGLTSGLGNPTGYFDQGEIRFTSGVLNGLSFTVRHNVSGAFTIVGAFPALPTVGDTFDALPGCDLTRGAGGCAKFNNLTRFRGFDQIPPPETPL